MRDQCPAGEQYAIFGKDAVKSVSIFQKDMSALGQKQTFASQKAMSALPPKADIQRALEIMGAYDLVFIY
jgi:hypothetical protein